MIEPIRDILYSSLHSEQLSSNKRWTSTLRRQLQTAEVELVAPLGKTEVTLGMHDDENRRHHPDRRLTTKSPSTFRASGAGCHLRGGKNGQYALKIDRFLPPDEL